MPHAGDERLRAVVRILGGQRHISVMGLPEVHAAVDQKDLAGAIAQFRQAIALDPSFAGAYYNLGGILLHQGQFTEALQATRQFAQAVMYRSENAAHCSRERGDDTGMGMI